jgi:deoxycytidylate deaminase
MNKRHIRVITKLINKATESDMCFRHSAALVKGGTVYSIGKNSDRACINGNSVTSTHAEVHAILNSLKMGVLPAGDIWVLRYGRDGTIRNSRPCSSCLSVIRQFKISRIFYSNDDGNMVVVKTSEFESDWVSGAQKSHGVNNIILC